MIIKRANWIKYADAVRDYNPLHRDDSFAKTVSEGKLEGAIAPGMWIASNFYTEVNPTRLALGFNQVAYEGQTLIHQDNKIVCLNPERIICTANPAYELDLPENKKDFVYQTEISDRCVREFLESVHASQGNYSVPNMFTMSLSAPALLKYGESREITGIHGSQSFQYRKPVSFGKLEIAVTKFKEGKRLGIYNLFWVQNDEIIAYGQSRVLPIQLQTEPAT